MLTFVERDLATPMAAEMGEEGGPVILVNTFTVPAGPMQAGCWKLELGMQA